MLVHNHRDSWPVILSAAKSLSPLAQQERFYGLRLIVSKITVVEHLGELVWSLRVVRLLKVVLGLKDCSENQARNRRFRIMDSG
jgi:hypothetical protein